MNRNELAQAVWEVTQNSLEAAFVDQGRIGESVPIGCVLNAWLFVPGMTLQKVFTQRFEEEYLKDESD